MFYSFPQIHKFTYIKIYFILNNLRKSRKLSNYFTIFYLNGDKYYFFSSAVALGKKVKVQCKLELEGKTKEKGNLYRSTKCLIDASNIFFLFKLFSNRFGLFQMFPFSFRRLIRQIHHNSSV